MSRTLISIYVLMTSAALILLKWGSHSGAPINSIDSKLQFNINGYIVGGIAFYGISFLLYMYLISKYDLGYIIPLTTALVYILIFTASFFIFKEMFTVTKIMGIALILLGIIFLNFHK